MEKNCINCDKEFSIRKYRATSAKFCSYRCAGQYRNNKRYKHKHELIDKICCVCNNKFQVENLARTKSKKTCSVGCKKILQANHLRANQYKANASPKRKRGRTGIEKMCVVCNEKFIAIENKRQQCCSNRCGAFLAGKKRRLEITKEDFQEAVDSCRNTYDLCDKLQCSLYTVMRRSVEYGIPYRKNNDHKKRPDGYYNYGTKNNHREIYQNYHNIKLLPKQSVHHIDGNKGNNNIDNLIHVDGVSEHGKLHGSLEKVAFELFSKGFIIFDREKRIYMANINTVKG